MVTQSKYLSGKTCRRHSLVTIAWWFLVFIIGCGGGAAVPRDKAEWTPPKKLPPMRHTIQVGAFSNMNNAVRFTEKLQTKGLNAYHFRHDSGLYKVRFGNYASKNYAHKKAENLKTTGMIEEYYIVGPKDYAALSYQAGDNDYIRNEIVKSAKRYIGVPYQWGGESSDTGFDCSGLTMVVYQLNGFDLPRSSRQQWKAGRPVNRSQLARGDLVFFATSGGKRVSHVGIYTGNGQFLHAPRRGRNIQISSLSNSYYKSRYLGARSYL
jgi:cell wall-associated NlpC family hydrolase